MLEHDDSFNRINKIIKDAMSPIYNSQRFVYDSLAPCRSIQNLVSELMHPFNELVEKYNRSFSYLFTDISDTVSKEISDALKDSFCKPLANNELTESIHRLLTAPDLINVQKRHTYDFPEDLSGLPIDDDYVVIDKSDNKEYEIPDKIAISIGHSRIKIKTSDFISILLTIISIFVSISISVFQYSEAQTKSEIEIEQKQNDEFYNQLLQSQNQMLRDLLHDIDLSSSSQAEVLQSLKESVESHNSAISDLAESLDSIQQSIDNTKSSVNTVSESK